MGYFAVAFSLGIIAAKAGLAPAEGFFSSFFTRASAGEYGTYTLVAVQAAYAEVVAMCLVVNLRYMLMSAALSQKIAPGTSWLHRLLMACCVTDEVFGISVAHPGYTPPAYTYAAALISSLFWASGCAVGIMAGSLLPQPMVTALSMSLYGMFLAIIIPPARQNRFIGGLVAVSMAASWLCSILPPTREISSGFKVILLTILIAGAAAALNPVRDEGHLRTDSPVQHQIHGKNPELSLRLVPDPREQIEPRILIAPHGPELQWKHPAARKLRFLRL